MGENAKYNGQTVKIGTCESMYYLRADQIGKVQAVSGSVDPYSDRFEIRFRFPFPFEDGIEPGAFQDHGRALWLSGVNPPTDIEHTGLQFKAKGDAGDFLLYMPCPLSGDPKLEGLNLGVNGYQGDVGIVQQKYVRDDEKEWLTTVAKCGGCGTAWRYQTIEDCAGLFDAIDAKIKLYWSEPGTVTLWEEMKLRIIRGYAEGK